MTLRFTLIRPLPLLNVQLRTHWAKRLRERRDLAWQIVAALDCPRPLRPFTKAKVTVERFSTHTPDTDNLVASCKGLLDCLCPVTDRRQYGLGIITDDNPNVCELHVFARKAARRVEQKTVVTIEALTS
jgi:hypothetical protein